MRVTYFDTVLGTSCRVEADYDEQEHEAYVSKIYMNGLDIKGLIWRQHPLELQRLRTECLDRCLEALEYELNETADNQRKNNGSRESQAEIDRQPVRDAGQSDRVA